MTIITTLHKHEWSVYMVFEIMGLYSLVAKIGFMGGIHPKETP
jgi:hypothetical protein